MSAQTWLLGLAVGVHGWAVHTLLANQAPIKVQRRVAWVGFAALGLIGAVTVLEFLRGRA